VYTRTSGLVTEIRIDLLDLPFDPAREDDEQAPLPDLYLLLDTAPGGSSVLTYPRSETQILDFSELEYDVLIAVPGRGAPVVYTPDAKKGLSKAWWFFPSLSIDRIADTLTIRLNRFAVPNTFKFQAITLNAVQRDKTEIISTDDSLQASTPVILAFYNTFPATMPAQALRRWDGAHTGPLGERHGLKHLLDAAQTYQTPLFLLDLKNSTSLSALDTVGATKQIQSMQRQGLLILPDNADGEKAEILLARNTNTAQAFGLNASSIYYGSFPPPPNYRYTFISLSEVALPARAGDMTLIPMPNEDESLQPDRAGLSLALRALLLDNTLNNPNALLVLGGDLPYSTWANADIAAPALAYLAARPYIQLLDEKSLTTFAVEQAIDLPAVQTDIPSYLIYNSQGQATGIASGALRADIVTALAAAPQNQITALAWDMFFALTAPTNDPKLAQLRAQYLSDIYYFIEAAHWAQDGTTQSGCDSDLNRDGLKECIIATDSVFAVIVPDGARLLYFFARDRQGLHQIVGPSWQFETGLSDRSTWNLSLGPAADSKAVAGAFVDADFPWQLYAPSLADDRLVFTSGDGARSKAYRFDGMGVAVTFAGGESGQVQIALALDPWLRFAPEWTERYQWGVGGWEVAGRLSCKLQATGRPSGDAFVDSGRALTLPEDPNLAYPGGHFLPYPLTVITPQLSSEGIGLKCSP